MRAKLFCTEQHINKGKLIEEITLLKFNTKNNFTSLQFARD